METKIVQALEKVRPMLQRDGGDVKFVSVDDAGVVKVDFKVHVLGAQVQP